MIFFYISLTPTKGTIVPHRLVGRVAPHAPECGRPGHNKVRLEQSRFASQPCSAKLALPVCQVVAPSATGWDSPPYPLNRSAGAPARGFAVMKIERAGAPALRGLARA
jgi:hypothetical protein